MQQLSHQFFNWWVSNFVVAVLVIFGIADPAFCGFEGRMAFGRLGVKVWKNYRLHRYLRQVFTELSKAQSVEEIERLLPWNLACPLDE